LPPAHHLLRVGQPAGADDAVTACEEPDVTALDDPPISWITPRGPASTPRPPKRSKRSTRPGSRSRRSPSWFVRIVVVVAVALVPVAWSYGSYLTAPGDAPVNVRTVDWLRDHGFESAVNDVEQWWYTRSKPTGSAPPKADIPRSLRHAGPGLERAVTAARAPAAGEAVWTAVDRLASEPDAVQQTFLHPDAASPAVIANVVRFDQAHLRTVYVPGLREPGGTWAWHSEIPTKDRSTVIAAFNAGFKFRHTPGGVFTEGRHAVRALEPGLASLVIHADGRSDVVAWPGPSALTSDVATVRQNLALIVDGGQPAAGLSSDRGLRWGTKKSQFQYTWRSAVGVDARGRLIYAAGSDMTLVQLARAMVDAGAVRAMQLDIHDGVVTFNWYRPNAHASLGVDASKLAPSMQRPATRYLAPDQRDFIAIQTR
jgi:hypothetical protein